MIVNPHARIGKIRMKEPGGTLSPGMRISESALAMARAPRPEARKVPAADVFAAAKPPPGVIPKGMALDSALPPSLFGWMAGSSFAEGVTWFGYPYLAELTQRPEYRRPSEILAKEMTRKWIKIKAPSRSAKAEKLKLLAQEMRKFRVRDAVRNALQLDGFFGRGHIFFDFGDPATAPELATPLIRTKAKIGKDRLQRLQVIEPMWTYPAVYNANNPLARTFYRPETWWVQGNEVSSTRLLTFIGREVPDMLKPAYSFGGLSLSQMAKPYVDNWLRARQSVSDLMHSFSVMVLATDMVQLLAAAPGSPGSLEARLDLFNVLRDNRGSFAINKATEELTNVSAPIAGLDKLQAQAQEQMASVVGIPLVVLLGITPSGLNACLPGDTLITTDRGDVQIRDVTTDDKVLTREGFASLKFAGKTKYANELIEIKTAGKTLLCTGNHPIWLPEAGVFVPAENVRRGHRLLLIGERPGAPKTPHRSHGAANGGGVAGMDITQHGTREPAGQFSFIGKYGRSIARLCQRASTSITEMATKLTTGSTIWSRCLPATMPHTITSISASGQMSLQRTGFANSAEPCSSLKSIPAGESFAPRNARSQAEEATGPLAPCPGRYVDVSDAARFSRLVARMLNFARGSVRQLAEIAGLTPERTISPTPKNGEPTNRSGDEAFVVSVRRIPASEWVYDLSVADGHLPEFYANGILTHNSSDGEIRVFYDWVNAQQEDLVRDPLEAILEVLQLNLFGEIDPDITFDFVPLYQLSAKEQAELKKLEAETDVIYLEAGAIDPDDIRTVLSNDDDGRYSSVDLTGPAPEPPDESGEEGFSEIDNGDRTRPNGAENPSTGLNGEAAADRHLPFGFDDFQESDHPRRDDGKFGSGTGGTKAPKPKLTPTEKTWISIYTDDRFLELNKKLRAGEDAGEITKSLDSAIGKSTLPTGTKLYRQMDRDAAIKFLGGRDIQAGSVLSDKAYMSTSTKPGSWGMGGVTFEIETGEGQKGLDLKGLTRNPSEGEVLLPRNTRMTIKSVVPPQTPGGQVLVRVSSSA